MQLDWLEILYAVVAFLGAGALLYRRGRRTVSKSDTVAETPPQKPPRERFNHSGTIEEVEHEKARNDAEADGIPDADAADAWRDF
jgi:hypothetical protein